jgi:hypothetical protein
MALANSSRAIGAVSQTLREQLTAVFNMVTPPAADVVTVGRPEPSTDPAIAGMLRLNLFLYEVHLDEFLKNESLDDGQPPPLWLVLRYLLTAFDDKGESDSEMAQNIVGAAMRALHTINFLQPTAGTTAPLVDNPNRLKVTFDQASFDLLSKLMQGPDMKYRFSAAFQVRPVLIAPSPPASYSQLVGVNYTAGGTIIGRDGVKIEVEPSLGPMLESVSPAKFEPGATLHLTGTDLNIAGLIVDIAGVALPISSRSFGTIECTVPATLTAGNVLSAASHPIVAVQTVFGHTFASNAVTGGLLPHLDTAAASAVTPVNANPGAPVTAVIDMTGTLLSVASDAAFVGFSSGGKVIRVFDQFTRPTADQKTLRLTIPKEQAVPNGVYRVILRVNGQQATNSPEVTL